VWRSPQFPEVTPPRDRRPYDGRRFRVILDCMGCSSCGGGGQQIIHQVRYPNQRIVRYATAAEAKAAAAAKSGAEYQRVQR